MTRYSLNKLGSEIFERLCQSLIQEIIGPGAKIYGMGKDGAREATFTGKANYPSKTEQWDGKWIFQAKFHDTEQIGTDKARKAIVSDLEEELDIISNKYRHPCDNYILITNVPLSPAYRTGTKDVIDSEVIPLYEHTIRNIDVIGAEELCGFLDIYTNIRNAYSDFILPGDIISRLLKLVDEKTNKLDTTIISYCSNCYDHDENAKLDDAGDIAEDRVSLKEIFIDLEVSPLLSPSMNDGDNILSARLLEAVNDPNRKSALSYLLDDELKNIVLIGAPGSGKSTLAQYVAQIQREGLLEDKITANGINSDSILKERNWMPRIPFSIILRKYAQWLSSKSNSFHLFNYIKHIVKEACGRDLSDEDLNSLFSNNPTLMIFDGLDEVPDKEQRKRIIASISSFIKEVNTILKGDLKVVATTRPYGYTDEFSPAQYLHINIDNLINKKAIYYTNSWIEARESNPDEKERIRSTFMNCLDDKVISVLTGTPLQVTILLIIIRARGTAPKQKEELFERYLDIVYQRELKKGGDLLRTESDMIYGIHNYVAYELHTEAEKKETAALMSLKMFKTLIKNYIEEQRPLKDEKEINDIIDRIVQEAQQRLVLIESTQEGKIGFGLTSVREYLAACYLLEKAKDTEDIAVKFKRIALSPHWRNCALFFAGRVARQNRSFTPIIIEQCEEIDREYSDKYLKRGADLIIDLLEDRVMREQQHEISAICKCIDTLKYDFILNLDKWLDVLADVSEDIKERVIRPEIMSCMEKYKTEHTLIYVKVYHRLYGPDESLLKLLDKLCDEDNYYCKIVGIKYSLLSKHYSEQLFRNMQAVIKSDYKALLADNIEISISLLRDLCELDVNKNYKDIILFLADYYIEKYEIVRKKQLYENEIGILYYNCHNDYGKVIALYIDLMVYLKGIENNIHFKEKILVAAIFPMWMTYILPKYCSDNANIIEKISKICAENRDDSYMAFIEIFINYISEDNFKKEKILFYSQIGDKYEHLAKYLHLYGRSDIVDVNENNMRTLFEIGMNVEKSNELEKALMEIFIKWENEALISLDIIWSSEMELDRISKISNEYYIALQDIFAKRNMDINAIRLLRISTRSRQHTDPAPKYHKLFRIVIDEVEKEGRLSGITEHVLYRIGTSDTFKTEITEKKREDERQDIWELIKVIKEKGINNIKCEGIRLIVLYTLCEIYKIDMVSKGIDIGEWKKRIIEEDRFELAGVNNWIREEILKTSMRYLTSEKQEIKEVIAIILAKMLPSQMSWWRLEITNYKIGNHLWQIARDKEGREKIILLKGMAKTSLDWKKNGQQWLENIKNCKERQEYKLWNDIITYSYCHTINGKKKFRQALMELLEMPNINKEIREAAIIRLRKLQIHIEAERNSI